MIDIMVLYVLSGLVLTIAYETAPQLKSIRENIHYGTGFKVFIICAGPIIFASAVVVFLAVFVVSVVEALLKG